MESLETTKLDPERFAANVRYWHLTDIDPVAEEVNYLA